MGQRERNKADKRARIAAAARALFVEHGFQGTTIRAIAKRAGVGTGTVLLHFASKTDLLMGLFVDELEAVVARQTATLPSGPLQAQLVHFFAGFLETYASQPELYRVYVKESMFLQGPEAERYDRMSQGFLATLAGVVASHREALRPEVDPVAVASAAFSLYLVNVALFLRAPEPALEPAVQGLSSLLEALLRPLWR